MEKKYLYGYKEENTLYGGEVEKLDDYGGYIHLLDKKVAKKQLEKLKDAGGCLYKVVPVSNKKGGQNN